LNILDLRTIVFADTINFIVCTLFVTVLFYQNRHRFPGLGFLVAAFTAQTTAVFLIMLRGTIPDLASIALANTLVFVASVLSLMGLERFTGKVSSQVHNFVLLALYAVLFCYFAINPTSIIVRSYVVSIGLLAIWLQIAWLMLFRVDHGMRRITFSAGVVYAGFCLTNVFRIIRYMTASAMPGDYMQSGAFEVVILQIYCVLTISLTIALVLMVNRRLAIELKGQEEVFATAFHSAPYGLILTSIEDGTVFEVNNGFLNTLGFSRAEVVGQSILNLHIWFDDEEREKVVREILSNGSVRDKELRFRKKSGESITGIFSSDIVIIGDRRCLLSGYNDISQRKRMEEEIRELSLRDPLTGLLNRRGFIAMTSRKIAEANRTETKLQFVFLDADGFKKINDTLGHEEGDRALQDLASILLATFRESDIVARVGGDEFTICFNEAADTLPNKALERLLGNIAAFNEQRSRPYALTTSFGTSTYDPEAPRTVDELLAEADRRMYRQKQQKEKPDQSVTQDENNYSLNTSNSLNKGEI